MRHLILAVYAVVCLGAITWPGYQWLGNRIEPFLFGLPRSLAWLTGWLVLTFFAVLAYHVTEPGAHRAEPGE